MVRIVFYLSVLLVSGYSFACSCMFPFENMDEANSRAAYVFIGSVESKRGFFGLTGTTYTFKTIEILKGESVEAIKVWSGGSFSGCGKRFSKNENYVVFAYENEGKLVTSRCSS
jgi:hypothetical protein